MHRVFQILLLGRELAAAAKGISERFSRSRPAWRLAFAEGEAEGAAALETLRPDAVVLEIGPSPGGLPGLTLLARARHALPGAGVILLAGLQDARLIRDAMAAGRTPPEGTSSRGEPDAFLFMEEVFGEAGFDALESQLDRVLHRSGRVTNETGVLITHGTDTMAWGLAYLRYALKDLGANVAVTGSQVPLEGYFSLSDALGNIKTSVYLLNRLRPPHLFAVFNNGRDVFSGRLTKYRKWDTDAFDGRVAASADGAGVRSLRPDWVLIPYEDQRLGELHLIRTGGTIESRREDGDSGALRPSGDFVWKYLNDALSGFFRDARRHDLFALDSSNVSFEEWSAVAREIEVIGVARADTRFDLTVRPVFANPLFTTRDYRAQFAACGAGAVFAGYGGGNANVLEGSDRSVLPALRQSIEAGTFVAVTSQVPLEPYDAEYETGLSLLEAGGVPCGDLPLADAQVKLSYILGHQGELDRASAEEGLDLHVLKAAAFLSGVAMRKAVGMEKFTSILEGRGHAFRVLPEDPFVGRHFPQALREVVRALKA